MASPNVISNLVVVFINMESVTTKTSVLKRLEKVRMNVMRTFLVALTPSVKTLRVG